mmetsp:Transcript_25631/g.64561  ORF Transcript_25631/g.64561 Transcript_25631/m.64561 type:complete len:161 (-) Transcript_25631:42-524(-)
MVLLLARLPVAKLFLLGVRQAARPVAKVAMAAAERSDTFQEACVQAARLVKSDRITLPRPQAVQAGCTLLGEAVVFGVSGAVLIYEYLKNKEAEHQKTLEARAELRREAEAGRAELEVQLRALEASVAKQAAELHALREALAARQPPPTAVAARPWRSAA